ncbi:phasin family protein [Ramlibacter sp. MMS24-I3-19]|uniref:phasin family protein n=1 Tax=Ramlibacter sp. MMS24-I3-19 TaxID=3416606 RepID=UPI003D0352D5
MRPIATSRPAPATMASEPLDLFSRATSAMVRAGGDVQQQLARSTGALNQQAMRELRHATNPGEILAVQTALMLAGWQQSMACSRTVANAWRSALEGTPRGGPARP